MLAVLVEDTATITELALLQILTEFLVIIGTMEKDIAAIDKKITELYLIPKKAGTYDAKKIGKLGV